MKRLLTTFTLMALAVLLLDAGARFRQNLEYGDNP